MRSALAVAALGASLCFAPAAHAEGEDTGAHAGANAPVAELAPAPPERKRAFFPTVGLGFGGLDERMALDLAGTRWKSTRADVRASIHVGLAHPVAPLAASLRVDGHGSLGFGPTFHGGRYQLIGREDVTAAYPVLSWLDVRAGLGPGLVLDMTQTAMTFAEIGLPIGVTFAGAVELSYRPYVSLALGDESRAVFGGSRSLSADTTFVPLDFTLRLRVRALGF